MIRGLAPVRPGFGYLPVLSKAPRIARGFFDRVMAVFNTETTGPHGAAQARKDRRTATGRSTHEAAPGVWPTQRPVPAFAVRGLSPPGHGVSFRGVWSDRETMASC